MLTSLRRLRPSWNDRRASRTVLRVEALEDRAVPSTVVYSETFDWNGVATVTATVTEDAPGYPGQYLWSYHLTNVSLTSGIKAFALPAEDASMAGQLGNSLGWVGSIGTFMGDPDLIAWQVPPPPPPGGGGDDPPAVPVQGLGVGQSIDFWFTTTPTALAYTNGVVWDGAPIPLEALPAGFLVAPIVGQAPLPLAPPPSILVATEVDKFTPNMGLTSLREAIDDVNTQAVPGLSRVHFTNGMDGKIITLGALSSLDLRRAVTIQTTTIYGEERNITVTRDATKGDFSLFNVIQGVTATIEGLRLTGGGGMNVTGGAVRSSGNTALVKCKIYGNNAPLGGGVYSNGGSLYLDNCQVYQNTSQGQGGGIAVDAGTLQLEDSFVGNNTAGDGGGGIALGDGVTWADIIRGNIAGNRSFLGMGGGIYVEGGTQAPTLLVVYSTTITANRALGDSGQGGGIAVGDDRLADVTLDNVSIQANSASTNGGGVYLGSGTLQTNGVIVTHNTAHGEGPGVGGGLYFALGTFWFDGPNPSSVILNTPDDVVWEV